MAEFRNRPHFRNRLYRSTTDVIPSEIDRALVPASFDSRASHAHLLGQSAERDTKDDQFEAERSQG